jgi:hypothetical protein
MSDKLGKYPGPTLICPKCDSARIITGCIPGDDFVSIGFKPDGTRPLTLTLAWMPIPMNDLSACLDCGCFWSSMDPHRLCAFVKRHFKKDVVARLRLDK